VIYVRNIKAEGIGLGPQAYDDVAMAQADCDARNKRAQDLGVDARYEPFEPQGEDMVTCKSILTGSARSEFKGLPDSPLDKQ